MVDAVLEENKPAFRERVALLSSRILNLNHFYGIDNFISGG